jgi:hypothetical protein
VAANTQGSQRQVSKVAHFANLDDEVGENVKQVLPPAADSSAAVVVALHPNQGRDSLHVGVHQSQKGTKIASIHSVIGLVS